VMRYSHVSIDHASNVVTSMNAKIFGVFDDKKRI